MACNDRLLPCRARQAACPWGRQDLMRSAPPGTRAEQMRRCAPAEEDCCSGDRVAWRKSCSRAIASRCYRPHWWRGCKASRRHRPHLSRTVDGLAPSSARPVARIEGLTLSSARLALRVEGLTPSSARSVLQVESLAASSARLVARVEGLVPSSARRAAQVEGLPPSSARLVARVEGLTPSSARLALPVDAAAQRGSRTSASVPVVAVVVPPARGCGAVLHAHLLVGMPQERLHAIHRDAHAPGHLGLGEPQGVAPPRQGHALARR